MLTQTSKHIYLICAGVVKGSRQPESRGVRNTSICPNLSRTAAINVLFAINFAVVFNFIYFRFRPSKAKWIGNGLPNRWNAAIRSMFFFSFITRFAYWRTESSCVIRRCAANRNKIWKLKTLQIWTPLPTDATGIVASIYWRGAGIPILTLQQISWTLFAAFCLFVRTLPIDFALLGRKRKYIKSKTTAKLTEKRTSIAAVRDTLWTYGTFPTPLLSRYRLPLIVFISVVCVILYGASKTGNPWIVCENIFAKNAPPFSFPRVIDFTV